MHQPEQLLPLVPPEGGGGVAGQATRRGVCRQRLPKAGKVKGASGASQQAPGEGVGAGSTAPGWSEARDGGLHCPASLVGPAGGVRVEAPSLAAVRQDRSAPPPSLPVPGPAGWLFVVVRGDESGTIRCYYSHSLPSVAEEYIALLHILMINSYYSRYILHLCRFEC